MTRSAVRTLARQARAAVADDGLARLRGLHECRAAITAYHTVLADDPAEFLANVLAMAGAAVPALSPTGEMLAGWSPAEREAVLALDGALRLADAHLDVYRNSGRRHDDLPRALSAIGIRPNPIIE